LTPLVKSGTSRFCRRPTMDKLIEREHAARNPLIGAPALAVQFFLIPLVVVAITGSVYVGFRSLLADDRMWTRDRYDTNTCDDLTPSHSTTSSTLTGPGYHFSLEALRRFLRRKGPALPSAAWVI